MNLGLTELEVDATDRVQGNEEDIIIEGNVNGETEEIPEDENEDGNLNQDDKNELKKDDSIEKTDNHKVDDQIPVRKSERIRKRLIDLNPEDIGDNDNVKDKDYKL